MRRKDYFPKKKKKKEVNIKPHKKDLNEMDINILVEKKKLVMVIKMLTKPGRRKDEYSKNINKERI